MKNIKKIFILILLFIGITSTTNGSLFSSIRETAKRTEKLIKEKQKQAISEAKAASKIKIGTPIRQTEAIYDNSLILPSQKELDEQKRKEEEAAKKREEDRKKQKEDNVKEIDDWQKQQSYRRPIGDWGTEFPVYTKKEFPVSTPPSDKKTDKKTPIYNGPTRPNNTPTYDNGLVLPTQDQADKLNQQEKKGEDGKKSYKDILPPPASNNIKLDPSVDPIIARNNLKKSVEYLEKKNYSPEDIEKILEVAGYDGLFVKGIFNNKLFKDALDKVGKKYNVYKFIVKLKEEKLSDQEIKEIVDAHFKAGDFEKANILTVDKENSKIVINKKIKNPITNEDLERAKAELQKDGFNTVDSKEILGLYVNGQNLEDAKKSVTDEFRYDKYGIELPKKVQEELLKNSIGCATCKGYTKEEANTILENAKKDSFFANPLPRKSDKLIKNMNKKYSKKYDEEVQSIEDNMGKLRKNILNSGEKGVKAMKILDGQMITNLAKKDKDDLLKLQKNIKGIYKDSNPYMRNILNYLDNEITTIIRKKRRKKYSEPKTFSYPNYKGKTLINTVYVQEDMYNFCKEQGYNYVEGYDFTLDLKYIETISCKN